MRLAAVHPHATPYTRSHRHTKFTYSILHTPVSSSCPHAPPGALEMEHTRTSESRFDQRPNTDNRHMQVPGAFGVTLPRPSLSPLFPHPRQEWPTTAGGLARWHWLAAVPMEYGVETYFYHFNCRSMDRIVLFSSCCFFLILGCHSDLELRIYLHAPLTSRYGSLSTFANN